MSVSLGMPRVPGRAAGPTGAAGRPEGEPALVDRFGRVATDLRVSLTDKCNLRCTYCMPAEGVRFMPTSQLLSADELVRLVDVGVRLLGVRELRLTGGEPLVRRDLEDIVGGVRRRHPQLPISMTSNGIGLAARVPALVAAGMTRLNVSLDTLRPDRFRQITRRDGLEEVLAGIRAARDAGLTPVKVNTVLLPGVNDDEAADIVQWAVSEGLQSRFIEQMPLGGARDWTPESMISAARTREILAGRFDLTPHPAPRAGAPAERWDVWPRGGAGQGDPLGTVGIIASVTEPFCRDCTRTRVTAEGRVRSCLFSHEETDLRGLLRDPGVDDEQLAQRWREAMWAKPRAHGSDEAQAGDGIRQPERTMSAIGG